MQSKVKLTISIHIKIRPFLKLYIILLEHGNALSGLFKSNGK